MVKRKKSQNENFFLKFWNGDLSLPMSYWVVGTGFGVAFAFLVGIFTISAGMSEDAMWGFFIPWQIYIAVGIWRSADKYKGKKFWSILAKISVVLGIVSNLFSILAGV